MDNTMDKVAEKNMEVTFADGTNDGEAVPKRWIAALVKMNCEKQVSNKLAKLGYDTYVPTQKEIHQWSDRKKRIDRIVIPMVVFVRLAKNEEDDSTICLLNTDVSALIEEEVLFLEPVAFEANVPLETNIQKDVFLCIDPDLLKKLVAILIDNAVKHGAPEKPVTITLTAGKSPQLSVHNFGTPISPEDLPHVFDRFYRSDKSRSTEGYGLGLAIAQSIANRLQGTLHVTSSLQHGTTFTATFKR